jgi:myo-inositol-1(or 4)-monophosphatase
MRHHPEVPPAALLDTAVRAARTAGGHALANRHRRHETVLVAAHDVKLKLDLECQEIAWDIVRTAFPTHAILAEESADAVQALENANESPYTWVIDPIDGTVNFTHGLPNWCCSVGVNYQGKTVAGAVFAPVPQELFTATCGGPACCNGTPLSVSNITTMKESLVLTGLDQKPNTNMPPLSLFRELSDHVQKTRVMGSAALDLCRVAGGQADGYFETGIYTWDVTAAGLIVEMAGGRTDILVQGAAHRLMFMASNGLIHDEFKAFLAARLHP